MHIQTYLYPSPQRSALVDFDGQAHVVINGRRLDCNTITALRESTPGHWYGRADGRQFTIEGGKDARCGPRDWMVRWDQHFGDTYVTSMTAALKLIEQEGAS